METLQISCLPQFESSASLSRSSWRQVSVLESGSLLSFAALSEVSCCSAVEEASASKEAWKTRDFDSSNLKRALEPLPRKALVGGKGWFLEPCLMYLLPKLTIFPENRLLKYPHEGPCVLGLEPFSSFRIARGGGRTFSHLADVIRPRRREITGRIERECRSFT